MLIDQLNTDNDVLYMIGDVVEKLNQKFNQETQKNKQIYNGIVDDLNCIFDCIDITKIFRSIHSQRYSNLRIVNGICISTNNTSRLRKLFSGYKYTSSKHHRVRHPMVYQLGRRGYIGNRNYIGCSYPKIHLADKLDRAIKNFVRFFHIHRYRYEDIQNRVCRHKAGIEGWSKCQY